MSSEPVSVIPESGVSSHGEDIHLAEHQPALPLENSNYLQASQTMPWHASSVDATKSAPAALGPPAPSAASAASSGTAAPVPRAAPEPQMPISIHTGQAKEATRNIACESVPYADMPNAHAEGPVPTGVQPAPNEYTATTHVPTGAPAAPLPSDGAPLVDAHHDKPVDYLPQSEVLATHVPYDTLDPQGSRELSDRMAKENQERGEREASGGDPEKQTWETTADPFNTESKFSLEMYLQNNLRERQERGSIARDMGLAFRNLKVTGYGIGAKFDTTVGSMLTAPIRMLFEFRGMFKRHVKEILNDVTGCVKPGEMLLVLGRPGSGSTTLLKSLCSYRDGYRSIEGDVLYEGLDYKAIQGPLRGEVVYAPEDDVHFPTLSVKDTLNFAAAARAPRRDFRITGEAKEKRGNYIKLTVEVIATILGLRHTYNTVVGDSIVRGVSGGERKRVSISEILAAHARIIMFDNSSRGLDSSTAYEFGQALRVTTDVARTTTVSSIYQAGESLTMLFDKVAVLNKGHCVYFGPVRQAAQYFKSIGYLPHDRQTTADFLVSVTDPLGRRLNPDFKEIPLTAEQQASAFRESDLGRANQREVDEYIAQMQSQNTSEFRHDYVRDVRAQRTRHTRQGSRYMLSWPQQIRLAIKRRAQIAWGDKGTAIIMSAASLFQALIIGSVYCQMAKDTSALFSRSGVIFFALLYNSFSAMAEVPNSYAQRPVVIRQQRFGMLHPSADALGNSLLDIPVRAITISFFTIVLYFMTGLEYKADKFFIFYFTVLLLTYTMVNFFRMVTAWTRSVSVATMIAGLTIIDSALYAGYAIPRPSMVVWWRWLSYCNPVAFGYEVLITNEFRGQFLDCEPGKMFPPAPDAPVANKVCPVAGARPGETRIDTLRYADFQYEYSWENTNRNIGIVIGFFVFCLLVYMIGSEFQSDPAASGGVMVFRRGKISREELEVAEERAETTVPADKPIDVTDVENQEKEHKFDGVLHVSDDTFSWEHVNFDVMIKGNPRRLLTDVSGFVAPGKMTALMGESGAGKTTLLNVLAQRSDVGIVQGDFMVNGRPLPRSFQADTGYCQQQDVHLPQQTVREALQFSALLRQSRETPKEERLKYVDTVIELLEMQSFADALVGDVGEGLNVEQRKRLTIGVELAAKPSLLLFLDEPTSGLDAQAAWSIVRFLKKLAAEGQAILCTIHQPSGELFNQFDRLLLLQKGGKTAYFGELGENSMTLVKYFEERSGVKCEENANPAEYMLDVIGAGATATTDKDWFMLFRQSPQYQDMQDSLRGISNRKTAANNLSEEAQSRMNREYAQPFNVQLKRVVHRAFLAYWRDPTYIISKLFLNVFGGLFIGSSFWNQGQKTSSAALQNKLFAIFMSLVLSTSLSQQLQPVFINNRNLFETRERPSKLYSWPVFLISAIIVEIPWNILGGTLFWIPWYFMVRFGDEGTRAGYSWGLYMLFQLYFATFAQAVAAIAPNAMVASILFSTFFSFVIVFCGVVQPPTQLPHFWSSWMFPLSPFTYIIEGQMGNAIHDKPIICEEKELNMIVPPDGQSCDSYLQPFSYPLNATPPTDHSSAGYYISNPDGTCGFCSMRHGEDYLDSIEMNSAYRYRNLGILCAYIGFNLLLVLALYYFFRIHRWKGNKVKPGKKTKKVQQSEQETQESSEGKTDSV